MSVELFRDSDEVVASQGFQQLLPGQVHETCRLEAGCFLMGFKVVMLS